MKDNPKAETNLCIPPWGFSTLSPTHFSPRQKNCVLCAVSASTPRKRCSCCARECVLAKQRGPMGWVRSVLRNQGESFLVTVPAIVPNPSKSMPVVGRQNPPSCVYLSVLVEKCRFWWKKHPQRRADRIRNMLPHRKHISSPAGSQTVLHFARALRFKVPRWFLFYPEFYKQWVV